MAVALDAPGAGVVIDDALGRRCAQSLGLHVVGTVGIVVTAQRRGVIQSARSVLLELRSAGMWLSDDVIERALRIAGLGG